MQLPLVLLVVLIAGVIFLCLSIGIGLLVWVNRSSGGSRANHSGDNLTIDVSQLDPQGPSATEPAIELYGLPCRLAVLVLAPLGRGKLPHDSEGLRDLTNYLLPELGDMLGHHQPIFRRWPAQLSVKGFPHAFFTNLQLPGNKGQGTPWCSVAGKFSCGDSIYLAGLVLCGKSGNSLGQVTVEHEGKWNDILRIRK